MKRIIFLTSLAISLFIIIGLVSSIISLWHKQDVLTRTQKELSLQQKEHDRLTKELKNVGTHDFLEQEARNKLFFVKPGEGEVIIAQDLLSKKPTASGSGVVKPNWQQWLSLFF